MERFLLALAGVAIIALAFPPKPEGKDGLLICPDFSIKMDVENYYYEDGVHVFDELGAITYRFDGVCLFREDPRPVARRLRLP
jgi:hypothetical protein